MRTPNKRLRKLRENKHLTQAQLGEKIGLKGSQIRDMELGKVKVGQLISKILQFVIGINPDWLLTGRGEMFLEFPIKEGHPPEVEKVLAILDRGDPGDIGYLRGVIDTEYRKIEGKGKEVKRGA